jgi:hypothetical protein
MSVLPATSQNRHAKQPLKITTTTTTAVLPSMKMLNTAICTVSITINPQLIALCCMTTPNIVGRQVNLTT